MDNSISFSIDTSLTKKSFFSSFSSQVSSTTWKPLLNSVQENQRLSRLIQVREGKLQELKGQPQNLQNILQGKNHSQVQDLTENLGQNFSKLDEILLKSQTNLQILCSKLGKIPKNIENAMNIVPVQPKSLTTSEKLECLEVFEILKEKLTTFSLDSEEVLGYFKDIVLESEANAVNMNIDKEPLMKLVDKRVEIFQSDDITRTKIQEAFHLAMNLENWKRGNIPQESFDSFQIKKVSQRNFSEISVELYRKSQEIEKLKEKYRNLLGIIRKKSRVISSDVKKLKHCVEFELFNTWNCLLGDDSSEKPSCSQIFNRLAEYQNNKQIKIGKILKKFKETKGYFQKNKDQFRSEFKNFFGDFKFASNKVLQSLAHSKNLLNSCRNDLDLVKKSNFSDIQEIKFELSHLAKNKLNFAFKIKNFANQLSELQSANKEYKKSISNDLEKIFRNTGEYKDLILNKIVSVRKSSQILKQQQIETKKSVKIEIQELGKELSELYTLKLKKIKNLSKRVKFIKNQNTKEKIQAKEEISKFKEFMDNKINELLYCHAKPLALKVARVKSDLVSFKKMVESSFQSELQSKVEVGLKSILNHRNMLINNHSIQQKDNILKRQENLQNEIKTNKQLLEEGKKTVKNELYELKKELTLFIENNKKICEDFCKQQESLKSLIKTKEGKLNLLTQNYLDLIKIIRSWPKILKTQQKKCKDSYQSDLNEFFKYLDSASKSIREALRGSTEEKERLKSRNLETTKELKHYKDLNTGLEHQLNSIKFSLLGKEQKQALLVQENKLPQIRQNLGSIRLQVLELQQNFNENFENLKKSINSNKEKSEILEFHIFQLETSKKTLENSNSQLEKNLAQCLDFKRTVSTTAKQKRKNLWIKVEKILRKLKALKSVLTREKEIIKCFHTNLYDWIINNITHSIQEEYEFRYNLLTDALKEELQIKENQHLEEISSLNREKFCSQAKVLIKKFRKDLAQSKVFIRNSSDRIFSEFSNALTESIGKMMKNNQKKSLETSQALTKFKEKVKNKCETVALTLSDYKAKNHEVYSILDEFIRLFFKEKEIISSKILSLWNTWKSELDQIKASVKDLRSSLESEIATSDLQQPQNLRSELVLPINNYIKDHQANIEELSEFCIKASDSSSKAIEENINKYEDFFERIEDLQEEGYSLLTRYKQDPVVSEYADQGLENIDDFLENNCEVSLFSNPDEEEKKLSIQNNPLLKRFNVSNKSFMRIPTLIRIIEEVLDKKFKSDSDALLKNRDPSSMAQYLISSLKLRYNRSFDKKINEIMHTFKENMADPLIKFYCRMFQVFDTNPIPYKLSIYLIKMRFYYYYAFVNKQVIPQAFLKKTEKMQIIEILKTVRKLFNSDSKTGEVVLKLLKPEELTSTFWTITCIRYYLYSKSINPESCYSSITKEKTITESQFVEGLSCKHETLVSENDLKELFLQSSNGVMTQEDFERLLDVKSYFEVHQKYTIDHLQFLNALVEGYASMRIRHYKELEVLITSKVGKKEKLTREDVALLLSDIDPNAKPDKVFDFTQDLTIRLFKKKIFELNLGGKGMGCFNLKSIEKVCDSNAIAEDEKIFK